MRAVWAARPLYLFLAPFAILTALFGLWPIGEGVRLAFTDSSSALSDAPQYVGLANFIDILQDRTVLLSLWRTVLFTGLSVVLNVGAALALALLLAHPALSRGRTLFKLAVFLPVIVPESASFIVWKSMLSQNVGVVNHALAALGLPGYAGLTTPGSAFASLVAIEAWHHVGLYTLVFLTNLLLVDPALTEAASLDGAGRWARFWHVVLPQLRPAITINAVTALIEFLKTFTAVFVMTKGGPNFSTDFLSYLAYTRFNTADYGQAAAMATVLFALVAALTFALFRGLNRPA